MEEGPERAALSERLLMLSQDPDYTLDQINGQRIYRRKQNSWPGPEPTRDCEVFIGRIPKNVFEDTLIPMFQNAGTLFEFRLMICFSGFTRGYAFAMYSSPLGAENAIRMYNNYYIRQNWQLGVCRTQNNCRLLVSHVAADTSDEDIVCTVRGLTEEAIEVRVRRQHLSCTVVVEFKTHRGAAMARKALLGAAQSWDVAGGSRLCVDWWRPNMPLTRFREIGRLSPLTGVVQLMYEPPRMNGFSPGGGVAGASALGGASASAMTGASASMMKGASANMMTGAGAAYASFPAPPTYSLEPYQRENRLKLIHEAQLAGGGSGRNGVGRYASTQQNCRVPRGEAPPTSPLGYELLLSMPRATRPPDDSDSSHTGSWSPETAAASPVRGAAAAPSPLGAPGEYNPWGGFSLWNNPMIQ